MRVCLNGNLKHLFHLEIDLENDSVVKIKEKLMKKVKRKDPTKYQFINTIRLFDEWGNEFTETDGFESLNNEDIVFFSLGISSSSLFDRR